MCIRDRIITSIYAKDFEGVFSDEFYKKVAFDGISDDLIEPLKKASFENLEQLSLNFSDGFIIADGETPKFIEKYLNEKPIPGLDFQQSQIENALVKFYTNHIL